MKWIKSLFLKDSEPPLTKEQLDDLAKGNFDNYYQNSWQNIYESFLRAGLSEKQAVRETNKRRQWYNE